MTNIDLYKQCLASVRKQGVGTLTPETFVIWVNRAQDIVVGNKLAGMDINARHRDDLNPLLEIGKTVVLSDNIGSLPADYRRMMNVAVTLTSGAYEYTNIPCDYLSPARRLKATRSAYQAPSTRRCYYTTYSNVSGNVLAITAPVGFSITCKIDYYRNPAAIAVGAQLTPVDLKWGNDVLNEIISQFTMLYLAHVGDQRLQSQMAVKQQTNTTN